jgi:hypothetical protein
MLRTCLALVAGDSLLQYLAGDFHGAYLSVNLDTTEDPVCVYIPDGMDVLARDVYCNFTSSSMACARRLGVGTWNPLARCLC